MSGERKLDPLFLESQIKALEEFANEKFENGCEDLALHGDGEVEVGANGVLYRFDSVMDMVGQISGGNFI